MSTSPGTARDRSIDWLAEDFGDVGIVDRHRNDLESGSLRIFRDVIRRLLGIDLDPEHGDALRLVDHARNAGVVVDEMPAPRRSRSRSASVMVTSGRKREDRARR